MPGRENPGFWMGRSLACLRGLKEACVAGVPEVKGAVGTEEVKEWGWCTKYHQGIKKQVRGALCSVREKQVCPDP